jgi:hypothetical protein
MFRNRALGALALLLSGCGTTAAQTINTLEYRGGELDARILAIGRQSGLVLTNEAVVTLRSSVDAGDLKLIAAMIGKLPVIHLVVSPVPPRDYAVTINGTRYQATEESKYGVQPGPVELKVERDARTPCVHKIVVRQDQTVRCDM